MADTNTTEYEFSVDDMIFFFLGGRFKKVLSEKREEIFVDFVKDVALQQKLALVKKIKDIAKNDPAIGCDCQGCRTSDNIISIADQL